MVELGWTQDLEVGGGESRGLPPAQGAAAFAGRFCEPAFVPCSTRGERAGGGSAAVLAVQHLNLPPIRGAPVPPPIPEATLLSSQILAQRQMPA